MHHLLGCGLKFVCLFYSTGAEVCKPLKTPKNKIRRSAQTDLRKVTQFICVFMLHYFAELRISPQMISMALLCALLFMASM